MINKPTFSVNSYDNDGDRTESGIYLNFGEVRIRVAENINEFSDFISHLEKIHVEIEENYHWSQIVG